VVPVGGPPLRRLGKVPSPTKGSLFSILQALASMAVVYIPVYTTYKCFLIHFVSIAIIIIIIQLLHDFILLTTFI
jgi:hypothetical protein